MWGGSKFKRPWLIDWLTGKEFNLYLKGYRWNIERKAQPHVILSNEGANSVADYCEKHLLHSSVKKMSLTFLISQNFKLLTEDSYSSIIPAQAVTRL
jgi:hypothetical protein